MKFKRVVALVASVIFAITILAGCGSDTPLIGWIIGLKDSEVFKVDKEICTKPEYMIQMLDTMVKYRVGLVGEANWDSKVEEDKTLEDFVKDKVKEDITIKYKMSAMAKQNGVVLTDVEKSEIKDAAKKYFSSLTQKEKDFCGATQSDVEKLYQNYKLADKMYEKITEDVEASVSDEETRTIKLQYIRMDTDHTPVDKINDTLKEVRMIIHNNYQPFSREAKQYSEDTVFEKNLYKAQAKEQYEKEAFNLSKGEVSEIINVDKNYYLVYCADDYLKKESAENKQKLIKDKKDAIFNEEYKKYVEKTGTDFNSRSIEGVKFPTDGGYEHCNLLEVYKTIK